ncbi:unannotated protein [freshwater metagenome]|jgi:hypothetical protein|uniref:Unannotated protein n=2 Tax=freshwater metagenome TaxID=449393 RepID=A0A6J7RX70_9ZZZZ
MNMSSSFVALIWWVIPAAGLIGALGYVVWVTKFKNRFESETSRSIGKFKEFQSTFRDPNDHTPVNRNDPMRNEIPNSNQDRTPPQ